VHRAAVASPTSSALSTSRLRAHYGHFPHLARAAFRALSLRCALVIFFARAVPPALPAFSAISLRRSGERAADLAFAIATACGFLAGVFTRQAKANTASPVLSME
jgi:hypothetical protein